MNARLTALACAALVASTVAEFAPGTPGPDGKPPARPTMVPGSFKVMVYELVK